MKEIFYENSISSFLYDYKDNNVIIIPRGAESPFEHLDVVYSILSNINKSSLNVYFDFCLLNGISDSRFIRIQYNNRKFSIKTKEVITEKDIPQAIKEKCNKYFKTHSKNMIDKTFLTDIEKILLQKCISFA